MAASHPRLGMAHPTVVPVDFPTEDRRATADD